MSRIVKTPKRGKKTPQLGSLKRLSDPSKMRPSRLRKPVPRRNKALQEEDSRESVAVSLDRTTFANMPGVTAGGSTLTGEKQVIEPVEKGTKNAQILPNFYSVVWKFKWEKCWPLLDNPNYQV